MTTRLIDCACVPDGPDIVTQLAEERFEIFQHTIADGANVVVELVCSLRALEVLAFWRLVLALFSPRLESE
jgi:hypothetical protein